jgi:hypothetical protein
MARHLAQDLVAKVIEIKRLSSEVEQIKLELYSAAAGGIQCEGGRVVFVDAGSSLQFDRAILKSQLISKLQLTDQQAENFIEGCKTEKSKVAYIAVYVD